MEIFLSILNVRAEPKRSVFGAVVLSLSVFCFVDASIGQTSHDAEMARLNGELERSYTSGNYTAALDAATKLVDLTTQKYGKDDIETARALRNLGFVENAKGGTRRAENTMENAVSVFKKQRDLNNKDGASFAGLLEALAAIKMREALPSGENLLELALKWREKSNGPEAPETATPIASLAVIKFWGREYKKSADLYKRALTILSKNSNDRADQDLLTVYYRTRCTYRKAKIEDQFEELKNEYDAQLKGKPMTRAQLIQGGVLNGKAIQLPKPRYSAEARQARAQGPVRVEVLIGESGEIISACASADANPLLAEVSEIAAYGAKFSPTTLQGKPVKVSGQIVYNFSIN